MALSSAMLILIIGSLILYILSHRSSRLRPFHFPSPSILAAWTPFWAIYHNIKGQRYLAVDEAHRQHGPVVVIAPNNLSFSDPKAYKQIYGHGVPILKDGFYDNLAGSTPSIADTSSRELHAAKRRQLSNIFSAKNITTMEPKVIAALRNLLAALDLKLANKLVSDSDHYPTSSTGEIDLRPWLNMFSFDAFSDMMWSSSFEFLKRGNDECFAMSEDQNTVSSVHAMQTFRTGVHFNTICAQLNSSAYQAIRAICQKLGITARQNADHFSGMVRYKTVERLKLAAPPDAPDFFSFLPTKSSPGSKPAMTLSELVAECTTFLNAGNDTTQITLTNTMYALAAHPDKQQKLFRCLVEALPPTSQPIASYSDLQHIPYLRACLDESLRLMPPVRFGLPRRTTGDGALIAGHHLPPNVTVSQSVHTLHHDDNLFHRALEYIPERWNSEDPETSATEAQNLKDFVLPFTLGGRACIGRNLAYMEISICLAALVMKYEWTISEAAKAKYTHFERFNASPVELIVSGRARSG